MDKVYIYKEQLTNYFFSLKNMELYIKISFNDFLYIILSNNPSKNIKTKELISKIIPKFNNGNINVKLAALKKMIIYINNNGLNAETNKKIYEYLLLQQYLTDSKAINDNNSKKELINQYNIKFEELIYILTK